MQNLAVFRVWVSALGLAFGGSAISRQGGVVLVSAASSLTETMNEVGQAFTRSHPEITVRFNFGASGTLEKQIEQGAPVDLFASAGQKEMDELDQAHKLLPRTRANFATNVLALIVPKESKIRSWEDLAKPDVRRIALPNPDLVPSGRYGKETLEHRKLWDRVSPKVVLVQNVRQALQYVRGGDVDAGIVFITDAELDHGVVRLAMVAKPGVDCPKIVYPAAVVADGPNPAGAKLFERFLLSKEGLAILRRHGFNSSGKG